MTKTKMRDLNIERDEKERIRAAGRLAIRAYNGLMSGAIPCSSGPIPSLDSIVALIVTDCGDDGDAIDVRFVSNDVANEMLASNPPPNAKRCLEKLLELKADGAIRMAVFTKNGIAVCRQALNGDFPS